MKETFIPIIISTLGTVTKRLIRGLEDLEISKEEKMNMNVLLMRINLNLIYGAQGSINMWGEKIKWKSDML